MSSAGQADVRIVPTMQGFRSEVTKEVDGTAKTAGNRFSSVFSAGIKGIGQFVGASLMTAGGLATGVAAIAIKGGIAKSLQIENATAKMTGLGTSTKNVKTVMDNALSAVKGTAFGLGDAANVASTAMASNIKPGAEMSKYLTLVADAASTAQVPLGEMGSIMGKVTNSGKVTNDVLNQFGDRGVGVLQMLAKHYGVTAEEMTKMVSKGKVDAATFNKVLTENVGGAAKKSGDTTSGAWANMKSSMANFGMVLSGAFFPLVKKVFNQIQFIFEGLTARMKPVGEAFSTVFQAKATPIIENFASKTLTGVDKMTAAFGKLNFSSFSAFISSLGLSGDKVGSSLGSIGSSMQTLAPAFKEFGQQLPTIGGALVKLGGVSLNILTASLAFLAKHVDTIIQWMPAIVAGFVAWKVASSAAAGASKLVVASEIAAIPGRIANNALRIIAATVEYRYAAAMGQTTAATTLSMAAMARQKVVMIASKVAMIAMSVASKAMAAAQWVVNAAMSANPIGLIIIAIVALIAGIVLLVKNWGAVTAFLKSVWQGFVSWFTSIMSGFLAWWDGIWKVISLAATIIWGQIQAVIQTVWQVIVAVVTTYINMVLTVIQTVWNVIATVFTTVWNIIQTIVATALAILIAVFTGNFGAISGYIASAWEKIKGYFTGAFAAIVGIVSGAWTSLKTIFLAGVNGVANLLSGAWNGIRNTVTNVWNGIVAWVSGIPGRFLAGIRAIANFHLQVAQWVLSMKNAAINKFNELVSWVTGLPGKIIGALGSVNSLLVDAGKNILSGFLNGLKSGFEGVKNFIGGIGQWIKDHKGPEAYDKALLVPAGGWIMGGLNKSMRAEIPALKSTLSDVSGAVQAGLNVAGTATLKGTFGGGSDSASLLREFVEAAKTLRPITVQTMSTPASQAMAVARAMEGV